MVRHEGLGDHPGATFGVIVGSLALLVSVLVVQVYASVQAAKGRLGGAAIQHVTTPRR